MNSENIFAGLPNNKIVLKAIAQPGLPNPFSHMSKESKKVLDELTAKKESGVMAALVILSEPNGAR